MIFFFINLKRLSLFFKEQFMIKQKLPLSLMGRIPYHGVIQVLVWFSHLCLPASTKGRKSITLLCHVSRWYIFNSEWMIGHSVNFSHSYNFLKLNLTNLNFFYWLGQEPCDMRATESHFHSLNYLPVLPQNIIIFKLAVLDF